MSERSRNDYVTYIAKANEESFIPCENKSGSIVLDVETTGQKWK